MGVDTTSGRVIATMFNRSVTLDSLTAWVCWLAGTTLAVGDMLDFSPEDSGSVGIAAIALGHLISVQRSLASNKEQQRTAFELGQDMASVRPLR